MSNTWTDIKLLNNDYKKLINYYFLNFSGKYIINKNILTVNFDSWGLEIFYIELGEIQRKYNILHERLKKIYNIGVSVQIGNWNTFQKMENYLKNFAHINVNLYFVIIKEISKKDNIDYLKNKYRECVILEAENKGMDIGLFLISLLYIKEKKYIHDYLYKLHTKTNDEFRNNTLNRLVGSHEKIINNIRLLSKNDIGMISGNTIYRFKDYKEAFQSNIYHLDNLVNYLYNERIDNNNLEFSAGTMFIIKMKVLNILNFKNLEYLYSILNDIESLDYYWYSIFYKVNINNRNNIQKDYNSNKNNKFPNNISYNLKTGKPGLRDCMIEHAMERLFGYICKKNNSLII